MATIRIKKRKYGNKKVYCNGVTYDSKKEFKKISELRLQEKAGEISELTLKPKFTLQEKFTDNEGKAIRAITYTPEASYIKDDKLYVFEVKSKPTATEAYQIRKKLFKKRYPDIIFIEIMK